MRSIYLNILLIAIILLTTGCNAQKVIKKNTSCEDNILVIYDKSGGDYNNIELSKNIKDKFNWVTVEFHPNFKDSIEIYFDDKLFTTKNIEKNTSSRTIFYKYRKSERGVKLFIKSLTNESCMEILLDKDYNLVRLNKLDNQWELEYSGYYEITWKE